MKKRRGLIVAVALIFAFATGVIAKDVFEVIKAEIRDDFVIEIDGEVRDFKDANGARVYPILHNGTTYLPLRAISEIMGKTVYWYEDDKRIEIKDEKDTQTTVTDADVIVTETQEAATNNTDANAKETPAEETYISRDKAKEIALTKAGLKEEDVKFVKVELDRERGTVVYEVEFNHGLKEYNADIKADDGAILKWEAEFDD